MDGYELQVGCLHIYMYILMLVFSRDFHTLFFIWFVGKFVSSFCFVEVDFSFINHINNHIVKSTNCYINHINKHTNYSIVNEFLRHCILFISKLKDVDVSVSKHRTFGFQMSWCIQINWLKSSVSKLVDTTLCDTISIKVSRHRSFFLYIRRHETICYIISSKLATKEPSTSKLTNTYTIEHFIFFHQNTINNNRNKNKLIMI